MKKIIKKNLCTQKINYGVKMSRSGYSVTDPIKKRLNVGPGLDDNVLPHMISVLALTYLFGAAKQVERYEFAARQLEKHPKSATFTCLHEASTLFEDLDTVDRYIELCGEEHELHKNILNIRNHIRHDLRDNLRSGLNDKRCNQRTRKLGISENLITNIGFGPSAIKVGHIVMHTQEIRNYLTWAEKVFGKIIKSAQEKGLIEGVLYDG